MTINAESTVLSEGKFNFRTVSGENKEYTNSKFTHEFSLSADGIGGGIKYTNDFNSEKEIEFSGGVLGFLGRKISVDPTNMNVSHWFIGIDIEAHAAAIFGISGEYKLGFGK